MPHLIRAFRLVTFPLRVAVITIAGAAFPFHQYHRSSHLQNPRARFGMPFYIYIYIYIYISSPRMLSLFIGIGIGIKA
jgi:hypothetical protein